MHWPQYGPVRAEQNSRLDARFVDLIAQMMAKDPVERISTAAEVVGRLEPWISHPMSLAFSEEEVAAADFWELEDTESSVAEVAELASAGGKNSSQTSHGGRQLSLSKATLPRLTTGLLILLLLSVLLAAALAWWLVSLAF